MKNKVYLFICIAFAGWILVACNKMDDFSSSKISDFTNLGVGKSVTYKLDSTITLPFGTGFTVHSYTIKDTVDAIITDNLNRRGYRIIRYMWNPATGGWENNNTFFAVQTDKTFEFTENNMLQVRLVSPIADNFSWQGNSHISTSPFNFASNDLDYVNWTFSYSNVNAPFTVNSQVFDTTITVVQYDSANNKPLSSNDFVNSYSRSYEIYAKGVGKIFQDLFSWEYQTTYQTHNCKLIHCANNICDTTAIKCNSDGIASNNCDSIARVQASAGVRIVCDTSQGVFSYTGYGVKLSIISHN